MHIGASTTSFTGLTLILPLMGAAVSAQSTTPPPVPCVVHPATPAKQKQIFDTFVDEFYIKRDIPRAFTHIAADYIQHNPLELDGPTSSFEFLNPIFSNPAVTVQILHRVFEAPNGWLHYRVDGLLDQPTGISDLFRFNGTCVQEHWDLIQERPVNSTNPPPVVLTMM